MRYVQHLQAWQFRKLLDSAYGNCRANEIKLLKRRKLRTRIQRRIINACIPQVLERECDP